MTAHLDASGNVKLTALLPAKSRVDVSAGGPGVDTSHFEGVGAAHLVAQPTNQGAYTIVLQHAVEDEDASYEDIQVPDPANPGATVDLAFAQITSSTPADTEEVLPIDFNKVRRFVRAKPVPTGTPTAVFSVVLAAPVAFGPVEYA